MRFAQTRIPWLRHKEYWDHLITQFTRGLNFPNPGKALNLEPPTDSSTALKIAQKYANLKLMEQNDYIFASGSIICDRIGKGRMIVQSTRSYWRRVLFVMRLLDSRWVANFSWNRGEPIWPIQFWASGTESSNLPACLQKSMWRVVALAEALCTDGYGVIEKVWPS